MFTGTHKISMITSKNTDLVELLMHMNGANNSTTFTDSSKNNFTFTPVANAKISTDQSKFGGASAYFDGVTAVVSTPLGNRVAYGITSPANTIFDLGTTDFTIECFIYITNNSPSNPAFSNTRGAGIITTLTPFLTAFPAPVGWFFGVNGDTTTTGTGLGFGIVETDGIIYSVASSTTISQNTWHHVAFTRQSGVNRLFLNGNLLSNNLNNNLGNRSLSSFSNPLRIATLRAQRAFVAAITGDFNGYIDELRLIKGKAEYTTNFTPPSSPFLP